MIKLPSIGDRKGIGKGRLRFFSHILNASI
jgi:hypothetical protein